MPPLAIAWLALLALPTAVAALYAGLGLRFDPLATWEQLVDQSQGRYWPIAAALLPPCIAIAWKVDDKLPGAHSHWLLYATVAVILSAVAVVQFYGQERNNRDRIKTEGRFTDLFAEISEGRREAQEGRNSTEALFVALLDEIRAGRREAKQERDSTEALFVALLDEIREGRRESTNGICDIADAITALAATAEEARRERR